MKNVFVLLISAFVVFSCKNVEQFKAPIEALSADWDKTTTGVTDFAKALDAAKASMTSMVDSFTVDTKAKIKPEMMAKMDEAKTAFMAQHDGLASMATEVADFSTAWGTMGSKLTALTEGLKAGKLDGDVMGQINELKTAVTDAGSKMDGWKTKLNGATDTATKALAMFNEAKMAK